MGIFYQGWITSTSLIAAAMVEGSSNTNTNFGNGLDLANHSYSTPGYPDQEVMRALKLSWRNNTINIAARGNNGHIDNALEYPACYINEKWIINVVASGDDGQRVNGANGEGDWSSSYGVNANPPSPACYVDVMAPGIYSLVSSTKNQWDNSLPIVGCDVPSEWNGSNYSCFRGTSAAAAHVTGVATLMYTSHDPNHHWDYKNVLSTEDIEYILEKTTQKTPNQYNHTDGYGLVDAKEAVKQVTRPYTVKHNNYRAWDADLDYIGTTTPQPIYLNWAEEDLGIPNGTAFHSAEKWRARWDVSYTPSGGNQIIDWWKIQARSIGGQTAGGSLSSQQYYYQSDPIFIENYTVDMINNSVSGYVDAYYWKFYRFDGSFIWLPEDPNENLRYTYALHLLDNTLNTDSETMEDNLVVYPNPSNSEITVANIPLTANINTITIYDPTGRVIKSIPINNNVNEFIVNIEELSVGFYYLQLLGDNYKNSTKFYKN